MIGSRTAPAWRLARAAAAALGCGLLGACANGVDTAWKLVQQQQELQAMARQHETRARDQRAPAEPQWLLTMMREAGEEGRYFAALAYGDDYRQRFGARPEVELLRAEALRLIGQAEESEAIYRSLLPAPQAWHGLGLLAGARGDYGAAAETLAQAARLLPTQPDVLNDLGYARLRAGQWPQARLPLGQAAELDPDNPRVLANLALLLAVQGEPEAAMQVMTRAGMDEVLRAEVMEMAEGLRRTAPPAATAVAATAMAATAAPAPMVLDSASAGPVAGAAAHPGAESAGALPSTLVAAGPAVEAARPPLAAPVRFQPAGQSPVLDAFGAAPMAPEGKTLPGPSGPVGG